ncbi:MAG: TlyA family rRNA (cytidine-2'-O)-methyltransferase [Spirochaetales bacterium]|nr:TlyA family rRNA (cytidine-2'-O)-methyltransferase [Spirochaetales bacterium]
MKKILLLKYLSIHYPQMKRDELLARILCGEVFVDAGCIRDPKYPVLPSQTISIHPPKKYVSRGGEKLHHALDAFSLDVAGKACIDAGSSTGGFTDCLLKHGAIHVYSVDVGYCQLDYVIRKNPAVTVLERTNIMQLKIDQFPVCPNIAVMDLSFRSVRGAARHLLDIVSDKTLVALVKPQFEWKNPDESFTGVIDSSQTLHDILIPLAESLFREKTYITRATESPIKGKKGNREFFFLLSNEQSAGINEIKKEIVTLL